MLTHCHTITLSAVTTCLHRIYTLKIYMFISELIPSQRTGGSTQYQHTITPVWRSHETQAGQCLLSRTPCTTGRPLDRIAESTSARTVVHNANLLQVHACPRAYHAGPDHACGHILREIKHVIVRREATSCSKLSTMTDTQLVCK